MARIVRRLLEPPHECPYLPGRTAMLDVAVLVDVSSDELGVLLERGWRRFGLESACDRHTAQTPS